MADTLQQEEKAYVGTKIVRAKPMNRNAFLQTKSKPEEISSLDEEGYLVLYEDGYTSWSPKDTFERCYRQITDSEAAMIR